MSRTINCAKLQKELPAMAFAPFRGPLGKRIYREISQEAWELWLKHSTMVINEYRLNPSEEKGQTMLLEQIENFFFGDKAEPPPPDFVPAPDETQ